MTLLEFSVHPSVISWPHQQLPPKEARWSQSPHGLCCFILCKRCTLRYLKQLSPQVTNFFTEHRLWSKKGFILHNKKRPFFLSVGRFWDGCFLNIFNPFTFQIPGAATRTGQRAAIAAIWTSLIRCCISTAFVYLGSLRFLWIKNTSCLR